MRRDEVKEAARLCAERDILLRILHEPIEKWRLSIGVAGSHGIRPMFELNPNLEIEREISEALHDEVAVRSIQYLRSKLVRTNDRLKALGVNVRDDEGEEKV